jgi:ArsR family transcriptional regulator
MPALLLEQATPADLESLASIYKALSDPARLKILSHLSSDAVGVCGDGICACDLEDLTGLSQPTVSHHMKLMQQAGLVRAEKRGKWMYYSLEPTGFKTARGFINALNCC